jgi:hypothetical protein
VIDDPLPWKDELVTVAERLEAKTSQTRWNERTGFLIERDFVIGAYALRKLVESRSGTDELAQYRFPVLRYERVDDNGEDIEQAYDLENASRRTLSVVDLCYELLHGVVFGFCCGETADLYDGIYVASERNRGECVYLVLASDFIGLCGDAAV